MTSVNSNPNNPSINNYKPSNKITNNNYNINNIKINTEVEEVDFEPIKKKNT